MSSSTRAPVLQFHRTAARTRVADSLTQNGFAADIFHNPHDSRAWTFILTRDGNPEILYWGREHTLEMARGAALAMLQVLAAGDEAAVG